MGERKYVGRIEKTKRDSWRKERGWIGKNRAGESKKREN